LPSSRNRIVGVTSVVELTVRPSNSEEIRYSWEIDNMYMISNPEVMKTYSGAKKIENIILKIK